MNEWKINNIQFNINDILILCIEYVHCSKSSIIQEFRRAEMNRKFYQETFF
jgi:hypothetical protein